LPLKATRLTYLLPKAGFAWPGCFTWPINNPRCPPHSNPAASSTSCVILCARQYPAPSKPNSVVPYFTTANGAFLTSNSHDGHLQQHRHRYCDRTCEATRSKAIDYWINDCVRQRQSQNSKSKLIVPTTFPSIILCHIIKPSATCTLSAHKSCMQLRQLSFRYHCSYANCYSPPFTPQLVLPRGPW
jgi:hypothetical protein